MQRALCAMQRYGHYAERMSCAMSKVLAIILAGGQGERLSLLSQKRAKPAVPFAGKYRIIDFALSNCVNCGIHLLQPYIGRREADWYQGTADAVYQNLSFIMETPCDYVLVLAGDHIYRMDYGPMITFHQQRGADATLGAVVIPIEDASRFGILETDVAGRVASFEEKPKEARGTLGSMGIYVFNRETLIRVLIEDAQAAEAGGPP